MTTYLWNWRRTRRHILHHHADGERGPIHIALCGMRHDTRDETIDRIRTTLNERHQRRAIERLDTVPVCKRCERVQAKAGQP